MESLNNHKMDSIPLFIIPDRLRGIPLVSDTPGWRNEEPTTSSTSQPATITTMTSRTGGVPSTTSSTPPLPVPTLKSIQLDKRHVDVQPVQTTSLNGLLFKPQAMTASTSNIVVKKTTTTTKRPTTTMRPTTTRKPTTTTTTSTRRPKTTKQPQTSRKPVQVSTVTKKKVEQVMSLREVPTQTSARFTTASVITTSSKMAATTTTTTSTSTTTTTTTPATKTTTTTTEPTRYAAISKTTTSSQVNLTRAMQPLTTQPGFQRRTQQTVGSPRFINRPSGYAGENWVLFNQPGGQFSFFETMTLLSSILMVSTVIAVLLFNWFRSCQKRNATTQSKQTPAQQQTVVNMANSKSPITSHSSNLDKISTVSGANQRPMSGLSTTPTSIINNSNNKPSGANLTQLSGARTPVPEVKTLAGKGEQLVADSGLQRTISSEFKTGAMNVANKAMAIVQPTENNEAVSRANSDSDKLKESQRLVNRSVSDLSGSQQQQLLQQHRMAESSMAKKDTAERVSALEEIFYGSAPNLKPEVNNKPEGKEEVNEEAAAKNRRTTTAIKNEQGIAPERLSASSLESIELPEPLVESIKRAEARNPTTVEPPSPNPLLAEARKALADPPPSQAPPEPLAAPSAVTAPLSTAVAPPLPASTPQANSQSSAPKTSAESLEKGKKETNKPDGAASAPKGKAPPTKQDSRERTNKPASGKQPIASNQQAKGNSGERPSNPMAKLIEDEKPVASANKREQPEAKISKPQAEDKGENGVPQVKNHQVVVNKLDKRKTNLEIVDIRDESVTGKMRNGESSTLDDKLTASEASGWISMDGVAVVQPARPVSIPVGNPQSPPGTAGASAQQTALVSPSEIIEGRFKVDYSDKKKQLESGQFESVDDKQEELNNLEEELEADNKLRNRKYFVYIVQDGHFTAKKECIARIELPQKRRITLAEVRHLIANSRDISLSSLRRNKFKFVTETYRLLNENEDAAVLHQVYPTQGVFLKLNIPEQETQAYQFKGRGRLSTSSGNPRSSVSQTTIASRRRATSRGPTDALPAIEVDYAQVEAGAEAAGTAAMSYGRTRASSVGRRQVNATGNKPTGSSNYRRSKSNVQTGRRTNMARPSEGSRLPPLATNQLVESPRTYLKRSPPTSRLQVQEPPVVARRQQQQLQALGNAATDLGTNVISGVKQLFSSTFRL